MQKRIFLIFALLMIVVMFVASGCSRDSIAIGDDEFSLDSKEVNLKAKSLKNYCEKYKPSLAIRSSMSDYKKEDWLINLPLYSIEEIIRPD